MPTCWGGGGQHSNPLIPLLEQKEKESSPVFIDPSPQWTSLGVWVWGQVCPPPVGQLPV